MMQMQYHIPVYIPQVQKLEWKMSTTIGYQEFGGIWWYSENYFLSYSFSFLSVLLYEKI